MTNATLEQISEAAAKPLADVEELAGIREAVSKMDFSSAISNVSKMGKLRTGLTFGEAVSAQLALQKKGYSFLDCMDIVDALVYESFGEV